MSATTMEQTGGARVWDAFLTERDREIYAQSGYGARQGFGKRPCLMIVDVTIGFLGDKSLPAAESNKVWPDSCGEIGWKALDSIGILLDAARSVDVPVIYTTGVEPTPDGIGAGRWADKNSRWHTAPAGGKDVIASAIAPRDEIVIAKSKPSAFFGSPLASLLVDLGVDSIIVGGTTTSGCVRATVVDAFSLNYKVSVVEECTFDRGDASHAIGLFDMDLKYADVVSLDSVLDHLRKHFPQ